MNIQHIKQLIDSVQARDKAAEALNDAKNKVSHEFRQLMVKWPLDPRKDDHVKAVKEFAKELRNLYINGLIEKEGMERIFKEIPYFLKPYIETAIAIRNAQEVLGTSNKKRLPLHEYINRLLEDFEVAKRHATGEQQIKLNSTELEFKEKMKSFHGGKPQNQQNFPLRRTLSGKVELKTPSQPAEPPATDASHEVAASKA